MSEKRQIKLEMQVNNEDCDVVTKVTDTAVTDALGYTPMDSSQRGATNGVASLTSGKVPASELPSYVDDVIEGYYYNDNFYSDSSHTQLITGETGKIYVDLAHNSSYRYTGSAYVEISQSITVDNAINASSTNPVQNSVIKAALDAKVDVVSGKGLSTNDFNGDYKAGLDSGVKNATFITAMDAQYASLKSIWKKLGGSEWKLLQDMVRAGEFSQHYSVGDQLNVNYNGSPMVWDIVAIDVATPADTSKTHSVTLMPHNRFYDSRVFDAPEPNNPNSDRKNYGNNRYAHSAIRQWLNSSANAGSWWTSQHEYDAAPDYATTVDGFMKGFDADFLAVLGLTKFKVARNTVTDGGGYEELTDTFYLPSKMEVGLGAENSIEEGIQFPYFTDNASRIKYKEGTSSANSWWLRTPNSGYSDFVRHVGSSGTLYGSYASGAYGVAPACNII